MNYDRNQVVRTLDMFIGKGGIAEIRILNAFGVKGRNDSGYFDNFAQAAGALQQYAMNPKNPGIYFVLNPFSPELMARASNRFEERAKDTTQDSDITRRRWLFIDCDPKRKTGISSTEEEWQAAKSRAESVAEWLTQEYGFPEPVTASSGNGFHLHYRIDLEAGDESRDMVKNCLRAIAAKFDDDAVTIDTKVFNAARICKLYGTMARKGDSTADRPHRMSEILTVPSTLQEVPAITLLSLAGAAPVEVKPQPKKPAKKSAKTGNSPVDRCRAYLDKVPGAISGESGHDWTYHAACIAIIDFNLSFDEAFPLLMEWNQKCEPPWSESELMHKLESVDKLPDERGRALQTNREKWEHEQELILRASGKGEKLEQFAFDKKLLADIGIVYCCETETTEIEIFSSAFRKFTTIKDPAKLTYPKLLQMAGEPAQKHVNQTSEDCKQYSMNQVRNAIALVAGSGKRGSEKLGAGIWRLNDKIVMANGSHLAVYDGSKLVRIESAVFGNSVFDIGGNDEWFDFADVASWINREERDWVYSAIIELCAILEQWCFKVANPDEKNHQICAEILGSLIVASFIQSFWTFRPMVFLLGESNCGKSTLFELLCGEESDPTNKGLMGSLAIYSANQSAAGIRQAAERSSRPVFIDELEKGKHRVEILELLRGASRGSQSIRGSAGQKAVITKLAFMAWAASTESGLMKQVDQNRWIQIQMVPPDQAKMGKLKLPSVEEIQILRNKLIAAAVVIGMDSRLMVDTLMANRPRSIDHRICQIFAVPGAVFATMTGMPQESAVEAYKRMLNTYDQGSVEKDQDTTLETILTSPVRMHGSEKSLLSILQVANTLSSSDMIACEELLATHGMRIIEKHENRQTLKFLFIAHRVTSRTLLKGSPLEGVKIDELLLRLPGASRAIQKITGKPMRGVMVPYHLCVPPEEPDLFCST